MAKKQGAQLFGSIAKETNLSEVTLTAVVGQIAQLTDKQRAELFQFACGPSSNRPLEEKKVKQADTSGDLEVGESAD